jgi:GxxExxY protein
MQAELKQRGLNAGLEHRISVQYKGEGVGEYAADLLVENRVIVELKVRLNTNLETNHNCSMS